MFAVGEKVVYGTEGVFTVSEYAASPVDKNDKRIFYVLRPMHGPESNVIYTPAEGGRVSMRAIMCREDALALIERMPTIETLTVDKEKNRRDRYREIMTDACGDDYVSIIKTIYSRRMEFMKLKKRLSEADTEYERRAKFCLYGELSAALELPFDEVEPFIADKLDG